MVTSDGCAEGETVSLGGLRGRAHSSAVGGGDGRIHEMLEVPLLCDKPQTLSSHLQIPHECHQNLTVAGSPEAGHRGDCGAV